MNNIETLLRKNEYPGRGIVIGVSKSGTQAMLAYFIMGRSENSRNRIFSPTDDGIKTQAYDPAKLVDPSLIIYSPVRKVDNTTIVTNGDQTDTVFDFLKAGKSFADALRTRTFEPDAPNFTPRISGMVTVSNGGLQYRLSILKSACGNEQSAQRFFYEYQNPLSGQAHFIHTYRCDGDPIPSYEGEPTLVEVATDDLDCFTDGIWNSLNADNKVSLFTRSIVLKTGVTSTRIVNKNV